MVGNPLKICGIQSQIILHLPKRQTPAPASPKAEAEVHRHRRRRTAGTAGALGARLRAGTGLTVTNLGAGWAGHWPGLGWSRLGWAGLPWDKKLTPCSPCPQLLFRSSHIRSSPNGPEITTFLKSVPDIIWGAVIRAPTLRDQ